MGDVAIAGGFREEVANVLLAQLLNERSVVSVPEQIKQWKGKKQMPDVLVIFQGLRTAIEGKVDDHAGADKEALLDAAKRVETGIAHIGIAVLYPASLRKAAGLPQLRQQLSAARFKIAIFTEAGQGTWSGADLDHLAELLRRTFDDLVKEDVVAISVEDIDQGITRFAEALSGSPATQERAAEVLGIGEPEKVPGA